MRAPRHLLALAIALLIAGCGSSSAGSSAPVRGATLMLDFTPNAVHVGIYAALARRYDRIEHVRLKVIAPSSSTDPIKLLETGKIAFAILDIHDLAIARERGANIVGIMAVVERPLAAVIAGPGVPTPRELQGRTVGITGVPSDTAVLRSIVTGAGAAPQKVRTITIGFNAVPALLAGRAAAATAFWNDEGITLQRKRPGFHSFKVDDYGAPSYPELVLCTTRATLQRDPSLARSLVHALVLGYQFALRDPPAAAHDLESQVPGLDPTLVAAQLHALEPAFLARDGRVGELNAPTLRSWAAWEARFGIVSRAPDVAQAFDGALAAAIYSGARAQ